MKGQPLFTQAEQVDREISKSIGKSRGFITNLTRRQIDHDDSGVFFKAPEDNFFAIRRYIEVAEEKLWAEVGELTLLTRFQIDRPEVLVPELSFLHDQDWAARDLPSV